MTVSNKPSLPRILVEVFVPLFVIGLGLLSVLTYNMIGLLGVPIGLWLLVCPRSEAAVVGAFLLSLEICLWLAIIFIETVSPTATLASVTALPSFAAAVIAVGALGLLRAVRREALTRNRRDSLAA